MKICVLGAGVVGLTTAWWLSEAGHDVTIVDRNDTAGAETSAANGAQLSYGFVAPLASPAMLRKLPSLLLSKDAPMRLRPGFDPALISWGIRFLLACRTKMVRETTVAQLALAALSRSELERLTAELDLDFGLKTNGKLVIFRTAKEFETAKADVRTETNSGPQQSVLTPKQCLDLEPALQLEEHELAGGIFTPSDKVGDCAVFCAELSRHLKEKPNVTWQFGTSIIRPIMTDGRLTAVDTSRGRLDAECFVLSLGSASRAFAKACGFGLPIYPIKGYSLTLATPENIPALKHNVTDFERKLVFAPLTIDGRSMVRVAGIADIEGHDVTIDPMRVDILKRESATTLHADTSGNVREWCGLRPTTPDSRPIIGWSPVDGLFINAGQGMLGWTLACGSARLTADLIERRSPDIDAGAFALNRTA